MSTLGRLHESLVFRRRVRVLGKVLAELLPADGQILDVGCGDGSVARAVQDARPDLTLNGLEVMPRPGALIPTQRFDGHRIPYGDQEVDGVILVDVLHHTLEPEALLSEALRVARECVVIKDHTREGFLAGPTLRFMDWVGNAPHGVTLPYNYRTEAEWTEIFRRLKVEVHPWLPRLGLYPWPAGWLFDRSLHFVARLTPGGARG